MRASAKLLFPPAPSPNTTKARRLADPAGASLPDAPLYVVRLPTADGEFTAYFSGRGLVRLEFPSTGVGKTGTARPRSPSLSPILRKWQALTLQGLRLALAGRQPGMLPPLDQTAGTPFQRRVWAVLRRIPVGRTLTYSQVARAVGAPRAVRAVGGACGANPIPVLVPCHRVLRAHGQLGGFSAGLQWKRRLLIREGAWPDELWERKHAPKR